MARFRGTVRASKSNSTEVSRLGHKDINVRAASWAGAINVRMYADGEIDMVEVTMEQHHGKGDFRVLYRGKVGTYAPID